MLQCFDFHTDFTQKYWIFFKWFLMKIRLTDDCQWDKNIYIILNNSVMNLGATYFLTAI